MSEQYEPPFTMNEEITTLVIEIGQLVGHLTLTETLSSKLKLCTHKSNLVFFTMNLNLS